MSKYYFILFSVLLLYFNCNQTVTLKNNKVISLDTCLYSASPDWKIVEKDLNNRIYYFLSRKNVGVYSGSIVDVKFCKDAKIKSLRLQRPSNISKNELIAYKLYLNNKYVGKYNENQNVNVSLGVNSIRAILVKTGNEYVIRAWDENFNYSLTKDSSLLGVANLQFQFQLDTIGKAKTFAPSQEKTSTTLDVSPILLSEDKLPDRPIIFSKMERNGQFNFEEILNLDKMGNFKIFLLKSDRNTLATESNLFYSGRYSVFLSENSRLCIELHGDLCGIHNHSDINRDYDYIINADNIYKNSDTTILPFNISLNLPDQAMVNILMIDKNLVVNMPYATEKNFTQRKLYNCNKCFLRYIVIKKLLGIKKIFNQKGLNIKFLDCYRPYHVQVLMYHIFPEYGYVASPIGGSLHNRGTAVDISFTDMNGKEVEMGSAYDEFSDRSHLAYLNLPDTILKKRRFMHQTMLKNNFTSIRKEWWHFDFDNARQYPIMNDSFPCSNDW